MTTEAQALAIAADALLQSARAHKRAADANRQAARAAMRARAVLLGQLGIRVVTAEEAQTDHVRTA